MTKKGVAEWVSVILCLLPSPFVIMFLLIVAGEIREAWHITNFLAVILCAIVGLIALLFTSWVLGKLVYFIIKSDTDYERLSDNYCVLIDNKWLINFHVWKCIFYCGIA